MHGTLNIKFFIFSLTSNFCKCYHERVSDNFVVGYFNSRNGMLTLTSNMLCGWGKVWKYQKGTLVFTMGNICFSARRIPIFLRQNFSSCQEEVVHSLTGPSVSRNHHDISFSYSLDPYDI